MPNFAVLLQRLIKNTVAHEYNRCQQVCIIPMPTKIPSGKRKRILMLRYSCGLLSSSLRHIDFFLRTTVITNSQQPCCSTVAIFISPILACIENRSNKKSAHLITAERCPPNINRWLTATFNVFQRVIWFECTEFAKANRKVADMNIK